eukprot:TRINITY_DN476_c0_g1_i1.p1 TRINITY_DN476_c0_g1~~TRINITY_DN476_c0_g1_i1.p1  ORF type:complete len:385 (+),score=109.26 TRINITY_DN476_c0_g1_i1:39-1193(+)
MTKKHFSQPLSGAQREEGKERDLESRAQSRAEERKSETRPISRQQETTTTTRRPSSSSQLRDKKLEVTKLTRKEEEEEEEEEETSNKKTEDPIQKEPKHIAELIRRLKMEPHVEGGYFAVTWSSNIHLRTNHDLPSYYGANDDKSSKSVSRPASSLIYFLLTANEPRSIFHRLLPDEIYHFYSGDPMVVAQIDPLTKKVTETVMGTQVLEGHVPQLVLKGGTWFGSYLPKGSEYALFGCQCTPAFDYSDFEAANRSKLLKLFPMAKSHIELLTPPDSKEEVVYASSSSSSSSSTSLSTRPLSSSQQTRPPSSSSSSFKRETMTPTVRSSGSSSSVTTTSSSSTTSTSSSAYQSRPQTAGPWTCECGYANKSIRDSCFRCKAVRP